jgi:hypothetical protein
MQAHLIHVLFFLTVSPLLSIVPFIELILFYLILEVQLVLQDYRLIIRVDLVQSIEGLILADQLTIYPLLRYLIFGTIHIVQEVMLN